MSYITEDQQVEELKSWWKQNGKFIVVVFVMILAGVFGWRYWQDSQHESNLQLSEQYQQLLSNFAAGNASNETLDTFVQENSGDVYAIFTLLEQAKNYVGQGDLMNAEKSLQSAVKQSNNSSLTAIANLRLARVQVALKQYSKAETTLNSVTDAAWAGDKAEISADIAQAQNNTAEAKKLYQVALDSPTISALQKQILQLKIDSL